MIGQRLGPYEVLAKLGEGGMGEVYRARDTRLNRDVAIKVLPEAFALDRERLARFEHEAQSLAALNHPHVAQIYGFEQTPSTGSGLAGASALVMEFVDGEDLARRIARGPMPVADAMTPEPLPDGSLLVIRIDDERRKRLFRFRPDTGNLEPLNAIMPASLLNPAVRAFVDGREAVFHGRPLDPPDARDHLYALDLASNRARILAPSVSLPPRTWTVPLAASADGHEVLVVRPFGDLHELVAVPRDGSHTVRHVLLLPGRPSKLDVAADGTIYVDAIEQPTELLLSLPGSARVTRIPISNIGEWESPLLPLPDGRILVPVTLSGRTRIMALAADGTLAPLMDSQEDSTPPMSTVGSNYIALMLGTAGPVLTLVSSADGRIVHRCDQLRDRIDALAGSPDGKTIFYAAGGTIHALPATGGPARRVTAGHDIAMEPSGHALLVLRHESGGVRLVRVLLSSGAEEQIPVRGDRPIAPRKRS